LGSGFGSVSFDELHRSIAELLQEAAREPFKIGVKSASLRDVEALWNVEEPGVRLVFEP
jgi:hypothetical protein